MPRGFVDGGVRDFQGASIHPENTIIKFFGERSPRGPD
jgi:hypothetical protein